MLVHTVYFWLKTDLSDAQRKAFYEGVASLGGIACADKVYIGTPAETDRPVIDKSYDIGLTVLLEDMAAHDAYQVDPLHLAFLENFRSFWEKIVIYDAD